MNVCLLYLGRFETATLGSTGSNWRWLGSRSARLQSQCRADSAALTRLRRPGVGGDSSSEETWSRTNPFWRRSTGFRLAPRQPHAGRDGVAGRGHLGADRASQGGAARPREPRTARGRDSQVGDRAARGRRRDRIPHRAQVRAAGGDRRRRVSATNSLRLPRPVSPSRPVFDLRPVAERCRRASCAEECEAHREEHSRPRFGH